MNREELKLSLVEIFSKSPPTSIEINEELISEIKSEFWQDFKQKLDFNYKEGNSSFTINKSCIRWWRSASSLCKYIDSTEQEKQKVFATFTPVMCAELDWLGIPYEIENDYHEGLKRFKFNVVQLKEFSNVKKLGSLL